MQRIVAALEAEKLVIAASPAGRVRLGPTILRLASSVRTDFVSVARPFLVKLSHELRETVDRDGQEGPSGLYRSGDRIAAAAHRLRRRRDVPALLQANGKAYLAELDDNAVMRLIGKTFERRTPKTLTRLTDLIKDLQQVRRTGVAFDREEHTLGICAAGVALRDLLGNYVAISVPVPAPRFHEHQTLIAERLLATKRSLQEHFVEAEAA